MDFRKQLFTSLHGDEYYSPQNVVDMIVPYVRRGNFRTIWCPFDTDESRFVTTFKALGYNVINGHISTGQDFFDQAPVGDVVVTNPPYSLKDRIFERLYAYGVPFAVVMLMNGLFDNKLRRRLFARHGVELLIPDGRMKFMRGGGDTEVAYGAELLRMSRAA